MRTTNSLHPKKLHFRVKIIANLLAQFRIFRKLCNVKQMGTTRAWTADITWIVGEYNVDSWLIQRG